MRTGFVVDETWQEGVGFGVGVEVGVEVGLEVGVDVGVPEGFGPGSDWLSSVPWGVKLKPVWLQPVSAIAVKRAIIPSFVFE